MESTFVKLKCSPNPIMAKKISVSILVISLPLFYVSILQIPPSTLIQDTTFWFLMSNSIIIFIAADTGVLFSPSHDMCEKGLYDDLATYNRVRSSYFVEEQLKETNKSLAVKEKLGIDQIRVGEAYEMPSPLCVKQNDTRNMSTRDIKKVPNKEADKSLVVTKEKFVPDSVCVVEEESTSPWCVNENCSKDMQKLPNKEVEKALVVKEKLVDGGVSLENEGEVDHKALKVKNKFRRKAVKGKYQDPNVFNGNGSIASHEKPLHRSVTQEKRCNLDQNHEYAKLSDEELNRRIEDFIRRYYREMRLQLSNESG